MDDKFKNFAMIIPKGRVPLKSKWDNKYETFDELMADASHPYRWCDSGLCACMGCVNNWVRHHGYKKEDWDEWLTRSPAPPVDASIKSYGYSSFTIDNNDKPDTSDENR